MCLDRDSNRGLLIVKMCSLLSQSVANYCAVIDTIVDLDIDPCALTRTAKHRCIATQENNLFHLHWCMSEGGEHWLNWVFVSIVGVLTCSLANEGSKHTCTGIRNGINALLAVVQDQHQTTNNVETNYNRSSHGEERADIDMNGSIFLKRFICLVEVPNRQVN